MAFIPEPPAIGTIVITGSVAGFDTSIEVLSTSKGLFPKGYAPDHSVSITGVGASIHFVLEDPWLANLISFASDSSECYSDSFYDGYG